jgi:hypothetical protein
MYAFSISRDRAYRGQGEENVDRGKQDHPSPPSPAAAALAAAREVSGSCGGIVAFPNVAIFVSIFFAEEDTIYSCTQKKMRTITVHAG